MTTLKTVCLLMLGGLGVFHNAFASHTSDGVFGAGIFQPLQAKANQLAEDLTCPLVVDLVFNMPSTGNCPPPIINCQTTCIVQGPAQNASCNMPLISTGQWVQQGDITGMRYKSFQLEIRQLASNATLNMLVTPVGPVPPPCGFWYFFIAYFQPAWQIHKLNEVSNVFLVYAPNGTLAARINLDPVNEQIKIIALTTGYRLRVLENCAALSQDCGELAPHPIDDSHTLRAIPSSGPQATLAVSRESHQENIPNNLQWTLTNPMNDQMEMRFIHPISNEAEITLFDLRGAQLARYTLEPGQTAYSFPITDLPAGAYAIRLRQGGHVQTRMAVKY